MTEQEAIERIERLENVYIFAGSEYIDAFGMAIDALEEIQKYKNIGVLSADELEQDLLLHKADSVVLNQYKAIGTVEGCREAREKQIPKKPIRTDMCTCPKCGTYNETIKKRRNTVPSDIVYCWYCGQAIEVKRSDVGGI